LNPYETDTNASNALLGGQSADIAFGNPSIRPQAGLRTARGVYEQVKAQYDAQRAQKAPQPTEPMLGYDKNTDKLYSNGHEIDASNLSVLDNYDKAGFFNVDNTGKVPEGMPLVAASTVRAWMQQEAQRRGIGSAIGEFGKQLYHGIPDVLNMGVSAAAMNAPEGSWLESSLGDAAAGYEKGNEGNIPDVYGRNAVSSAMIQGARALAPSVAAGAASLAAPIVGTGAAGYIMGSSTAWDTYQRGIAAGLSPEDAKSAALKTGSIEGVGETAADALAARVLPGAGKMAAGLLRGAAPKGYGKKVAIDLLANAGVQAGTEVGQQYGQAAVERDSGIRPDADPWAEGVEAGKVGLALGAIMSPLGIAAGYANRPRTMPTLPPAPAPMAQPESSRALVPFQGEPVEDITPNTSYGFGYGQPLALPAPSTATPNPSAIQVSPAGTAVLPGQNPAGIQEDLFGATAEMPDYSANPVPTATPTAPQDATSFDMFPAETATVSYTPETVLGLINPMQRKWKALTTLAADLSGAVMSGNIQAQDAILEKLANTGVYKGRPLDNATVEAAHELVQMARSDALKAQAQEGIRRARPGQTVGTPAAESPLVEQVMEDMTTPETIYSAPNEMDPNLVPERRAKGSPTTLALRGQTQAQLDALNAQARWAAGPQDRVTAPAVPANQLHMFDRRGQPTNPAMGVPRPVAPVAPKPAAPVRKVVARVRPQAAPKPEFVAKLSPAQVTSENADLTGKTPVADNTEITANVPEDYTPIQKRMLDRIHRAYESDQIDTEQEFELNVLVKSGDTALAAAELHAAAVANVGIGRAKFRTAGKATGVTMEQVTRAVNAVLRAIGGKIDIIVKDSVTDVDTSQAAGSRSGMYKDGKVYIFRDALTSTADAAKAIFHELFHRGNKLRQADADYQKAMRKLYNQSGYVRAATNAWMKSPEGIRVKADMKSNVDAYLALAVDEAMAESAENLSSPGIIRTVGRWMAEIADHLGLTYLAQSLRTMGVTPLEKFIQETVAMGREEGGTGTMARTVGQDTTQKVWQNVSDKWNYDVKGAIKRGILSLSFLRDLGERFKNKFDRVTEYVDTSALMSQFTGALQKKATAVADAMNLLSKDEKASLYDFMGDVTTRNLSIEGENENLSDANEAKLVELKAQFDAMPEKMQAAYRTARDALRENWKLRADLLAQTAKEIYDPLIATAKAAGNVTQTRILEREKADYIADTNARLAEIKGDYFPLVRFGDWAVVRKSEKFGKIKTRMDAAYTDLQNLLERLDKKSPEQRKILNKANKTLPEDQKLGDFSPEDKALIDAAREKYDRLSTELEGLKSDDAHYYVAQFESESQAQAHNREVGGVVSYRQEYHKELNPISRQMLNRLEESMGAQLGKAGNAAAMRDAKRAMFQIYLASLPEASALKRQAKRKNVAGWNKDMQRNIISTMFRDSFFLSRLKYSDQLDGALRSVRVQADEAANKGEAGGNDLQRAAAELERRHAAGMKFVDTPVQDALGAWAYVSFLGISPGFLVANLMQPWLVSVPMMVARHGLKAMRELNGAYAAANAIILEAVKRKGGEISIENTNLPIGEKALLDYLLSNQLLNVTLAHDLSSIAEGGGRASRWSRMIAKPSHYVEIANRVATALAAYRLELAKTGDAAAAQKYAAKVVADTHFDYSAENAPYWMKPGVVHMGKMLFQFKKYQMGMISLFAKSIATAVKGETPAIRKEAMGTVAGLMTTHMAIAGSMGLPAAGAITAIFQVISDAFGDEPDNVEAEYRNWLAKTFGKEAGLVLAKGLPTLLGADMSNKVGAGNLVSPLPNLRETTDGRSLYQEILLGALGPVIGGLGPKYFQAAQDMAAGDYTRAATGILPKFMADPLRAGTFLNEGVKTRGGVTMEPEVGAWRAFITSTGVPSAAITDMYDANSAIKGVEKKMDTMATRFKREWAAETPEGRAAMQASLGDINAVRKKYGGRPITVGELYRFKALRARADLAYQKYGANIRGNRPSNDVLAQTGEFAQE